jgi:hypothetical protein
MRKVLNKLGWRKRRFEIKKTVDGVERESVSHEVDHVKGFGGKNLALEIQWNNKDPFFDRDLENLKRLHAEGVISVGIIVTRGSSLHQRMNDFVVQFARKEHVDSFRDLKRLGLRPTPRQRFEIKTRAEREGNSIALAVPRQPAFSPVNRVRRPPPGVH